MGDTPKWPQVILNAGMQVIATVRYLFLIHLLLRLGNLSAGKLLGVLARTKGGRYENPILEANSKMHFTRLRRTFLR